MNKSELIDAIAKRTDLSKVAAKKMINAYHDIVKEEINDGNNVGVVGFGTFTKSRKASRLGVNPSTGERIRIRARVVPKFKPGKPWKDSL